MAPIRIGLIGLTATRGAWANQAHLPYLTQSPHYQIVALANSSVASAEAAITAHALPGVVKAYGSPTDLAMDPDVDMVVVSVNVAKHYALVKPALEAGKMAFVEWPLGSTTAEAEELTALAREKNVKTVVGLQGRQSNLTRTVKGIVESGRLGKVLSSQVISETGAFDAEVPAKYKYFVDEKVGGTNYSIIFGHFFYSFVDVLGELESSQAILAVQRPLVDVLKDGKVVETIHRDAADHILVQGKLKSGAVASIAIRAGKPQSLTWKILCEKGEISVQAPGPAINWSYENDTVIIHVFENATGESKRIEVADMELEDVETPSRMIGRVYEAFASGETYPTFEDALEHHRRLDMIAKGALRLERDA